MNIKGTYEQRIEKMQAQRRLQHQKVVRVKKVKKKNPPKEKQPKVIGINSIVFFEVKIGFRKKTLRQDRMLQPPHAPLPDLMAENAAIFTSLPIKQKDMSHSIVKPCHVPNPAVRKITRVPEEPKKEAKFVRPVARYDNIISPYGLATQMLQEQMEEELRRKTG